jgi:hypothetical protein
LRPWTETENTTAGADLDDLGGISPRTVLMLSGASVRLTGVDDANFLPGDMLVTHCQGGPADVLRDTTGESSADNRFRIAGLNSGESLRLVDDEAALWMNTDVIAGGTTTTRYVCLSHRAPFCNTSANAAGDMLRHNGTDWAVVNTPAVPQALLQVSAIFTNDASITLTPPAGATWFIVRMKAGGGGGGGADADTDAEACAGGGGGEGGYHEFWHAIVSGNITGSVGAGGTAGTNTGGNGGAGGTTSVTYNGQTWSATGGNPGTGTAAGAGAGTATQMKVTAGGQGGGHGVIGAGHIYRYTQPGQSGDSGVMYSNGTTEAQAAATGGTGGGLGGAQGGTVNGAAASAAGQDAPGGATNDVRGGGGGGGGARIATGAATGAIGGLGAPGWIEVIFFAGSVPTFSAIT